MAIVDRRYQPLLGPFSVALSAVGFGLSPHFATVAFDHGIDPIAAAALRVLALMTLLLPWAGQLWPWRREAAIVAIGGAVSIAGFAGYFLALAHAPVAAATVVYYSYPGVVLVGSALLWRTRLRARDLIVCLLVLAGVGLAVGPIGLSRSVLVALAPAAAAPIGWAVYLLVLSGPAAKMPTMPKVLAGSFGGVVTLLPFALWRTQGQLLPMTPGAIGSMGLLALCTLAVPAVLVTWGAARTRGETTAVIGSLEFVVAVAAGWSLHGDRLSAIQLVGVGFVLLGALSHRQSGRPLEHPRFRSRPHRLRPRSTG